jgi:16S rRNA (adenine1518-N6/adenine1519-N6)-dimethyltransferase
MTELPALDIPSLLRKYDLHPSKGLGQNFLTDNQALQKIVSAADLKPADAVLEIGPGLGSLTRHLALAAHSVTAVELDARLFPALTDVLSPYKNIRLVQGDILRLDPSELMDTPDYLVVANIPYYITSAVIRHLLESSPRPRRVVLTIQREVADRICALPGKMSLLALSVQVYGRPCLGEHIPAEAFYPPPKVDSAILCVDIYTEPVIPTGLLDTFFALAKAGFSQKRKTLRNSISAGMRLPPAGAEKLLMAAGIDPQRRAETLDLFEWGKMSEIFTAIGEQ